MASSPLPYDLTNTLAPFLDRHLVFPLLEFLQKGRCDEKQIQQAKLELLSKTNMLDFAADTYEALTKDQTSPGTPLRDSGTLTGAEQLAKKEETVQKMKEKRAQVLATYNKLKQEAAPILRVIDDPNLRKQLANSAFTMQHLEAEEKVTPASLEALFRYAKFQFDCGNYTAAADHLFFYRLLSTNADRNFSALWGKFACEILMLNWEHALNDLNTLREAIDTRNFGSPVAQLQQRTWLIHWSLFVFFNHPSGRNLIVDMFLQDRYLNAIQTTCPHVLRYLTTAVITNKKRRNVLKDLVKVIQQENYVYRDPITEFIECLYINFDFESAQLKLRECEKVLANDFFLVACRDEFVENARLFIFETYCRIHQVIDISMLAQKLNMDQVAAEKWIVNLIRNARLDAKIDSAKNHVIMGTQNPSVYQQVIEKTKGLAFRSYVLANNITQLSSATQ